MFSAIHSFLSDLMGNHAAQFQKAVREGDTSKAYSLFYSKDGVREKLEPNVSMGADFEGNTCLHFVAYFAMKKLYLDLVRKHRGKPDMKNDKRQNCMHLLCATGEEGSVKRDMLYFTLSEGLSGMDLKYLLKDKDLEGNTVLHLAAGAGLEECVDLLVGYHADMVALNEDGLTPADLAKKNSHDKIAMRLEAHMLISQEEDETEVAMVSEPDPELLQEIAEGPVAMADQDLRSMKDKLLIETAEMLGVNLLTAEVLLRQYEWSKEDLLTAWLDNAPKVCEEAGVDMPTQDADNTDFLASQSHVSLGVGVAVTPTSAEGGNDGSEDASECGICCVSCDSHVTVPCGHHFCRDCWKQYLEARILGGDSEAISCPEYACYKRVPLEVIEGLVSREIAFKFLSFDLKAFVDSNPNIRWCPHPGCSQAVHKQAPPTAEDLDPLSPTHHPEEVIKGQTVHCGEEHYFCWDCLGEAHEPCTCEQWREWLEHVEVMMVKSEGITAAEADNAASSKWLVDFSKPCPKCRSPIEKTEGCNHMTCKKCRHDFCWVCMEDWKCHNSSTGGYFRCNRYDAQIKANEMLEVRKTRALVKSEKYDEISRFLHYYERYKEHIKSLSLEEPLLDQAQTKIRDLQDSILELEATTGTRPGATGLTKSVGGASTGMTITFDSRALSELSSGSGGQGSGPPVEGSGAPAVSRVDLSFIKDAVRELLRCRRVLKASYCYGYYLQGLLSTKQFEYMQGGLEQVTEMLAEAVARPHLRKPRLEIIRLTREAREKRAALVKQVREGFPSSSGPFLPSASFVESMEPPHLHRLFMDLDSYQPPSRSRRERTGSSLTENLSRSGQRNEDNMEEALAQSRRDYEADRQMMADVELAKTLSMQNKPRPSSPFPHSLSTESSAYSSTLPHSDSWLDQLLSRPSLSSQSMKNREDTDSAYWRPSTLSFDPFQCRSSSSSDEETTGQSPQHQSELPNSLDKWGPVFGEDEDLNLAIQESLIVDPSPQSQSHGTQDALPPSPQDSVPQDVTSPSASNIPHEVNSDTALPRHSASGYHGNLVRSDLAREPLHSFSASQSTDWHPHGNASLEPRPRSYRSMTEGGNLMEPRHPRSKRNNRLGAQV